MTIKKIELEKIYVLNGGFTWTPDSRKLIFAAGVNGWEDEKAGISLFQISLNTMKLKIFFSMIRETLCRGLIRLQMKYG